MTDKIVPESRTDVERLMLGENSIAGTLRLIGYILVFVLLFGTIFSFLT